ncbi:MAG: hypothetical protein H3C35_01545 [Bacteroidetes bacterium]|nr:hypothetical protein [Bacteroidota bacterium]
MYSQHSLQIKKDEFSKTKSYTIVTTENSLSNMIGPELQKSGSITRGFSLATNRDLTVNSGFRLQLAGKLSNEIDILAALTDENMPIQPQGNTQTLQELDNVFVNIKSKNYDATLGDFYFTSAGTQFGNVNRKLQGAKVNAQYRSNLSDNNITIVGASTRGKFYTNSMNGSEGVQGPYKLVGKNNEKAIIIIAGTERVYVDGQLMARGESNDYSIDYGSAEITFSTKRLITNASRIVVDFEYSDRQFTRNFAGGIISTSFGKNNSAFLNLFQEGDDPDSPIDVSLSESDKAILRNAGNSVPEKSGVMFLGLDSLGIGKGNYAAVDTIIDGNNMRFYRFVPGTAQSLYNIAFSFVASQSGDYRRIAPGQFIFVGIGNGEYLPIVFLPQAQLQQTVIAGGSFEAVNNLTVSGEGAVSRFDQNRFSSIGDNNNQGYAYNFDIAYSPKNISIGKTSVGAVDIFLKQRFKNKRFTSFDRINEIEFGRKWSTDSLSVNANSDETINEYGAHYSPLEGISAGFDGGNLLRSRTFSSNRVSGFFAMNNNVLPTINYQIENINGTDVAANIENSWFRDKGNIEYAISVFTPSFRTEHERRTVAARSSDSLQRSSYAYQLYAPKLFLNNIFGMYLSSELEWRDDEGVMNNELIPQSNSFTQSYEFGVKEVRSFSFSSSVILRDTKYHKKFQGTNANQQTLLIHSQSRYTPFSHGVNLEVYYDVATQKTAKLERYFYKVPKGEGQYIWVDANNNGIVDLNDENEFKLDRYDGEYNVLLLNGDQLFPIINLKTSSRLRIQPSRFLMNPTSFVEKILKIFSTETFVRIEERSSEPKTRNIYFLKQKYFMQPSTTLFGSQFIQQDLFAFENNIAYSLRFRFNQRKSLSQYAAGLEENYSRERSAQLRLQLNDEISNQSDIIFGNDNAVSSSTVNQSREISSSKLSTDFSYRPEQQLELGFKIETSHSEDTRTPANAAADFNGEAIRTVYSFTGNGQLRFELSREEVIVSNIPLGYVLPYELTDGRTIGKTMLWSVISEYRIGANLQFSIQYRGRTHPRLNIIHDGRMELRAFF